ncbi:MAG: hypothetical protein EA408_01910 [Marinilabiliales bacterium]|nr:MAG: hypothetical protein EA408_01910 [Marinilabiliales bacterium]
MSRIIFVLLVLAVITAGCLTRKQPVTRHYVLEYPHTETLHVKQEAAIKGTCIVRTAEVSPAYATHQIVLRENTHEIRYFTFNTWAVRPEQSLTGIIFRFLEEHNVFEAIREPGLLQEADYTLDTRIDNLEVISESRDHIARLVLEFRLTDNNENKVVNVHRADKRTVLDDRDLNLFAAAVVSMFTEELEKFTGQVKDILANPI